MVKMEPASSGQPHHAYKGGYGHHHGGAGGGAVGGGGGHSLGSASSGGHGFANYLEESARFANVLIEFENDNREMAVDVPDSFVAQTKTPPKYPPPLQTSSSFGVDREEARSSGSSFSALSLSNGHSLNRTSRGSRQSPPELVAPPSRDHLRIDKDGRFISTIEPPPLPTPEQSQRIKKYGEDIGEPKHGAKIQGFFCHLDFS